MLGHWRKINIDDYIANLKDFYNDCSKGYFTTCNTVESLNQEEKLYLNENLHLDKLIGVEKSLLLNRVLQDKSKLNFARHLLTSLNIDLDVNSVDESNKTIFELFIENAISTKDNLYHNQIIYLYKRGYCNTKSDELFLVDLYKTKIKSQQMLELWCLARICFILNNAQKIEKALSSDRVILTLISFKQGKPIGFNYPNLLGVANNAIQHYRENGDLILYAMKFYKVYEDIRQRDKKGTFKLKEGDYQKFRPIQDTDFNEIAFEIFPELRY